MYIIRDDCSPKIKEHVSALGFKNTILKYWPRSIDGTTFSNLITQTPAGAIKDHAHRKIYHVLGMKIKEMEKNPLNPDEIDYTFIHLNAYSAPNGIVSSADISAYIEAYSPQIYPFNKDKFNPDPIQTVATDMNTDPFKGTVDSYWDKDGWITSTLIYQPTVLSMVNNSITDAEIIQKVINISYTDIFYDPMKSSRLTAIAMLDIAANSVFETSARVISRSVVLKDQQLRANNIGKSVGIASQQAQYIKSATIELKFRRVVDLGIGAILNASATSFISAVETRCNLLQPVAAIQSSFGLRSRIGRSIYTGRSAVKEFNKELQSSVNQQLALLANWVHPHTDDLLLSVDPLYVNSYYPSTLETNIKIAGLVDLPPKEFRKTFMSLMKFDYHRHEKKGHWYDKVVSILIAIVTVVVAFYTGQWYLAAMVLGAGAVAEGLWAMYLVKNGGGSGAIHFAMGVSNALGIASMVAGITAIYQAWAQQGVKQMALEAAEKAATEAVEQGASEAVINTTAQALATAFDEATATSISTLIGEGISAGANAAGKIGLIDDNVAGIAGMIGGSYSSIATIGTTQATSITLDSVMNNIKEGIKQFITKPLSEILNMTMNWLNNGFNIYMSYVDKSNEGLADKAAQLEKSNNEVESTDPEHIENIWKTYQDPYGSCFESPDTTTSCIMMTTGKLRTMMNKCYDSGFKI